MCLVKIYGVIRSSAATCIHVLGSRAAIAQTDVVSHQRARLLSKQTGAALLCIGEFFLGGAPAKRSQYSAAMDWTMSQPGAAIVAERWSSQALRVFGDRRNEAARNGWSLEEARPSLGGAPARIAYNADFPGGYS